MNVIVMAAQIEPKQPGFFDTQDRLAELHAMGDPTIWVDRGYAGAPCEAVFESKGVHLPPLVHQDSLFGKQKDPDKKHEKTLLDPATVGWFGVGRQVCDPAPSSDKGRVPGGRSDALTHHPTH
jgi:hypothetical protein